MDDNASQYEYKLDAPIDAPVSRIVSLVPSLTESLFDINLGDRVIGITDYCTRPAEKLAELPRVVATSGLTLLRYELRTPSLEDIFLDVLGKGNADERS